MGELTLEDRGVPLQRWVLVTTSWVSSGNDVIQPTVSLCMEQTYYPVSDNQPGEFQLQSFYFYTLITWPQRTSGKNSDFFKSSLFPGKPWSCIWGHSLGDNSFLTNSTMGELWGKPGNSHGKPVVMNGRNWFNPFLEKNLCWEHVLPVALFGDSSDHITFQTNLLADDVFQAAQGNLRREGWAQCRATRASRVHVRRPIPQCTMEKLLWHPPLGLHYLLLS